VLTLAQPFLTTLVKQSGSPFYNHLLTPDNVKVPMVKTPIIREPFSKIAIDIAGPLSRTKKRNKYILIVIDEGTRYPEAFPLPSIEAERIVIHSFLRTFFKVPL
jgi:hypothetical protein